MQRWHRSVAAAAVILAISSVWAPAFAQLASGKPRPADEAWHRNEERIALMNCSTSL